MRTLVAVALITFGLWVGLAGTTICANAQIVAEPDREPLGP